MFSSHRIAVTLFVFFTLVLWLPSLFIPFWGDDYYFLAQARDARLGGDSWWLPFMSESKTGFWRPLSMDTGWRFVEQFLHGKLLYAHIYSWVLCLLSALAVACFAYQFARAMDWQQAKLIGVLTATMHAAHITSYLPLHWVAAMNSPTLVFFVCISLSIWIALPRLQGCVRWLALLVLPVLQLLALFSKELAILIPALVVVLAVFLRGKQTYKTADILVWGLCVLVCLVWLYFYQEFTPNRHTAYGLTLGKNLVTNALCFFAWIVNVPREALRMIVTERYVIGGLWAAACFIPMATLYWISARTLKPAFSIIQWVAVLAFLIIAYGPYFVLADQAYEYYAAVALIIPLLLVARALTLINRLRTGLLLMGLASLIAVQGTRIVEYPGVISRAIWAEQQLQWLEGQEITFPLVVKVTNEHQFAAIGVLGLSWRLGVATNHIILSQECVAGIGQYLVQTAEGSFTWESCAE